MTPPGFLQPQGYKGHKSLLDFCFGKYHSSSQCCLFKATFVFIYFVVFILEQSSEPNNFRNKVLLLQFDVNSCPCVCLFISMLFQGQQGPGSLNSYFLALDGFCGQYLLFRDSSNHNNKTKVCDDKTIQGLGRN